MKRLKLLIALAVGIMASSSGVMQIDAATYNYFVNFSTKEVANFSAFTQTFSVDTYNLDSRLNFYWQGSYKLDTCPTAFVVNATWRVQRRNNNTGTVTTLANQILPDLNCTTTYTSYIATASIFLPPDFIDYVINDDANFVRLYSTMIFSVGNDGNNRTLSLAGYSNYFDLSYDFNTTYLFNKFLSDQQFIARSTSAGWTITTTQRIALEYVYTTAGNDAFYINNTSIGAGIGTTRKKYAIDYNDEFFRGESVGAQFAARYTGSDTTVLTTASSRSQEMTYDYYFLNTANLSQAIVDAPTFTFTEEDCGSFLALNVGCFINNAFAYIVNDAPIVSDAFTLLNAGIEMAAQTFGIIGNFADDNVFGVLILAGFGFIAVKWFLKND